MPYAVLCWFDKESSDKINQYKDLLLSEGIQVTQDNNPHISLALHEDLPSVPAFVEHLENYAREQKPRTIRLTHFGVFPGESSVLYLSPVFTSVLWDLHMSYYQNFSPLFNEADTNYHPDSWVPHCTLGNNFTKEMLCKTSRLLDKIELPLEARLEQIGLTEFFPMKEIAIYPMGEEGI